MNKSNRTNDLEDRLRPLVMEVRKGNHLAYKTLLEELVLFIRRFVSAKLGNFGRQNYTEDITQETLLAIHLKLHTYNSDLPFLPWVRAVARHKLIDHLRRASIDTVSIDDEHFPELADSKDAESRTAVNDISSLLERLKPPAGAIIHALKIEGVSVREIAEKYKISESNVKVIVHRGLQKLSMLIASEQVR